MPESIKPGRSKEQPTEGQTLEGQTLKRINPTRTMTRSASLWRWAARGCHDCPPCAFWSFCMPATCWWQTKVGQSAQKESSQATDSRRHFREHLLGVLSLFSWLVVYLPLWNNMKVLLGWFSQYMENNIHVPNHQSDLVLFAPSYLL